MTGFGATETAPFALCTGPRRRVGRACRPAGARHGAEAGAGRREDRGAACAGPNITPGYWRDDALTDAAFDEEGFYRTRRRDAVRRSRRSGEGPRLRRTAGRGLQAVDRHLGQRRAAARAESSRRAGGLRAGRGDRRPDRDFVGGARSFPNLAACRDAVPRSGRRRRRATRARRSARARAVSGAARRPRRARAPAARRSWRGRSCSTSRRPSTRARSPTRDRSIRRRCSQNRAALVEELYAYTRLRSRARRRVGRLHCVSGPDRTTSDDQIDVRPHRPPSTSTSISNTPATRRPPTRRPRSTSARARERDWNAPRRLLPLAQDRLRRASRWTRS